MGGWVGGGWMVGGWWVDGWWVGGGWMVGGWVDGGWMGGGSGWEYYVRGCRGDVQCHLSVAMATLECYFT